jgi:hypothetical protein
MKMKVYNVLRKLNSSGWNFANGEFAVPREFLLKKIKISESERERGFKRRLNRRKS